MDDDVKLWVAGQGRMIRLRDDGTGSVIGWEFLGIFDTRADAIAACEGVWDFIGPAILNKRLPRDSKDWPDVFYPHLRD